MMNKIVTDAERIEKGDNLFTKMLVALEAEKYTEVQKLYLELMDVSISIEQRLAAQYLNVIANSLDKDEVKELLDEIYDYDGGDN